MARFALVLLATVVAVNGSSSPAFAGETRLPGIERKMARVRRLVTRNEPERLRAAVAAVIRAGDKTEGDAAVAYGSYLERELRQLQEQIDANSKLSKEEADRLFREIMGLVVSALAAKQQGLGAESPETVPLLFMATEWALRVGDVELAWRTASHAATIVGRSDAHAPVQKARAITWVVRVGIARGENREELLKLLAAKRAELLSALEPNSDVLEREFGEDARLVWQLDQVQGAEAYGMYFVLVASRHGFVDVERSVAEWIELVPSTAEGAARVGEAAAFVRRVFPKGRVLHVLLDSWHGTKLHLSGDHDRGQRLLEQTLRGIGGASDGEDLLRAIVRTRLANLHFDQGRYPEAERHYREIGDAFERLYGPGSLPEIDTWMMIARIYAKKGDYEGARELLERARTAASRHVGPETALMGAIAELLAEVAAFEGRGNESVDILEARLERTKRTFGERSEEYATALWELGSAQYGVGDLDGAHETLLRARALFEERGKTDSLDYAYTMQTLAHLVGVLGDSSTAVSLFEASLPIKARVLGRDHRKVGHTHTYIASEALLAGDQEKAERHFALAEEIYAPVFAHTLTTGTAAQRYRYTKKYYWLTDTAVSAYIDGGLETPEAARRAYRSVLRVKGRALEGSAASYRVIRGDRSSRTRQIAQRFAALHAEAAELALVGQRKGRSVAAVLAEAEELERQMNSSADQTVGPTYVPSIREIAAALPEQTALVELAIYEPSFGALVGEAPRYAAFVIDRSGLVALGPVAATSEVDAAAAELRSAIRACGAAGVECGKGEWEKAIDQAAKALSAVTIERLGEVIDGYDHLLIAPDGALNLVPFAMLPDRNGRPLIDTYSITCLTSGRDLFVSGETPPSRQPPVVVADPDFGSSRGAAARKLLDGEWETLEGTAAEAAAIAKLFPEARVLTRRDATEAAIKGLKSPGFLHVATHGFFVNGDSPIAGAATRGLKRKETQPESQAASVDAVDPLVRTGLALAGANRLESGDEDGILTALELGDIDLTGTELVALSACDTGVGEVRTGAGVYGLRRALIMAGAASQLMSLWPVDDQVTRQLMTAYYEALGRGEGRSQALRTAQLTVRAERANPYYWASFIPSGDWAPLGRSARRAAPTSPPGAAGPEVVRNEAGSSFGAPGLPALSLMLGGLGVSAASVGLGFWAKSTNDSLQDGSVRSRDSVDSMYARAKRLGLAADIGLVVGGAALATGAVLWLTGVSREATPVTVAVSDHGAFVRVSGSL